MKPASKMTDPARELAELLTWLCNISPSQEVTWNVLANNMGADTSSEFYDILSTIQERINKSIIISANIQDEDIDDDLRKDVNYVLIRMRNFFLPTSLMQSHNASYGAFLNIEDGRRLRWFSPIVRKQYPLSMLSAEDVKIAISNIDAALEDLETDDSVAVWAKIPVVESLVRLKKTIRFLLFFGHDRAYDDLLASSLKVVSVVDAVSKRSGGLKPNFKTTLHALFIIAEMFAAPHHAVEAYLAYKGWVQDVVISRVHEAEPRLALPKPPMQLSPPASDDDPSSAELTV